MPYRRRHNYIHADIETYSEVDLKEAGLYVYHSHPSTDVLCAALRIDPPLGDGKIIRWRPGDRPPLAVFEAISRNGAKVLAHNCAFDAEGWRLILAEKYGWWWPGFDAFVDSMAAGQLVNLPGNLDRASRFFPGTTPKDTEGHDLMMKLCKPPNPLKAEKEGRVPRNPKRLHTPEALDRLAKYCTIDIKAEADFYDKIPEMSQFEEDCWRATWSMNRHGVLVDVGLVQSCQEIASQVHERYRADLADLTGGMVTKETQRGPLAQFLSDNGLFLPLAKDGKQHPHGNPSFNKNLAHLVDFTDANEAARAAYALYETLNNSSNTKLERIQHCLGYDDRIRGMFAFSGAGQTGRWAGRLVQLHNLPRGILEGAAQYEYLRNLIIEGTNVETLEVIYGHAMDAVSSMIRACLIAAPGHHLAVADYRSIEGRVLAWAAGEAEVIEAYRGGMDMYKVAASIIFNVPYDEVTAAMRKVGKVAELACGYQGGRGAFLQMGGRKLGLTDERIDGIVKAWRTGRPRTTALWSAMNEAALNAMRHPKKRFEAGPFAFAYNRRDLRMRLPSGRLLYYRRARVTQKRWPDGGTTPQIEYYGVNKNQVGWLTTYGGKLTENAIQATARELMAHATVRAHKEGWNLNMTVHDELVSEEADRDHNMLCQLMEDTPSWSSGLPVEAAGFTGQYYRK